VANMRLPKVTRSVRRGFTLIELLVVITLISILAAILFPVFAQTKEAAKSTVCLSNLAQLSLAFSLYASDFDEQVMPARLWGPSSTEGAPQGPNDGTGDWPDPNPGSRLGGIWTTIVQPYARNRGILYCPSFTELNLKKALDAPDCSGDGTDGSGWAPGGSVGSFFPPNTAVFDDHGGYLSNYGVAFPNDSGAMGFAANGTSATCIHGSSGTVGNQNCPYFDFPGTGWWVPNDSPSAQPTWQNLSHTAIDNPAGTIFVGDGTTQMYSAPDTGLPRIMMAFGCAGMDRHTGGGGNYAFMDGHAKYLSENPEDAETQDADGRYYLTYLTSEVPK